MEHPRSWSALLQTSQHFYRIASALQFRTSCVFRGHSGLIYTSRDRIWPDFSTSHPWQGPPLESILANGNDATIKEVQVLHSHCRSCLVYDSAPDKHLMFPNLQVFHSYAPRSSKSSQHTKDMPWSSRGIPTDQEAPKLHTIVIHSYDAVKAWEDHCQSQASIRETKHMIINWWGKPHWSAIDENSLLQLQSGASVQALHILLLPSKDTKEWCAEDDIEEIVLEDDSSDDDDHDEGDQEDHIPSNLLVNSLAKLCASQAESIVIAGVERISPSVWQGANPSGYIPSSSLQTSLIQNGVQDATARILSDCGLSGAEIDSKLDRVKFQDLVNYAKNVNNPDELGGKLLEHLTCLPEYYRASMEQSSLTS